MWIQKCLLGFLHFFFYTEFYNILCSSTFLFDPQIPKILSAILRRLWVQLMHFLIRFHGAFNVKIGRRNTTERNLVYTVPFHSKNIRFCPISLTFALAFDSLLQNFGIVMRGSKFINLLIQWTQGHTLKFCPDYSNTVKHLLVLEKTNILLNLAKQSVCKNTSKLSQLVEKVLFEYK